MIRRRATPDDRRDEPRPRPRTTLPYADPSVDSALTRCFTHRGSILILILIFAASATLTVRAIRWDRWAHYEDTHRPFFDGLGGESYSSFKAWTAWRASWTRALSAAAISTTALICALSLLPANWTSLRSRSLLLVTILLHASILAWFVFRWGPTFHHPPQTWTG